MKQLYLKQIRANGGTLTGRIANAAPRGLILADNPSKLLENGEHIELNRHWAYSLYKRMGFVQRKPTTSKGKYSVENFRSLKRSLLDDVIATVEIEEIPLELILIEYSTCTIHFLEYGTKRVVVVSQSDKHQVTAILCGTILGDLLPLQIIY